MVDTTIVDEFYVTNGTLDSSTAPTVVTTTGSQKLVKIASSLIESIFTKKLIEVSTPRPKKDQPRNGGSGTSSEPLMQIVDLIWIREIVHLKGKFSEESGTTALSKSTDFETIMKRGGTFTILWGISTKSQVKTVNVMSWNVRQIIGERTIEGSGMAIAHADLERTFEVDAQFLVGTDR